MVAPYSCLTCSQHHKLSVVHGVRLGFDYDSVSEWLPRKLALCTLTTNIYRQKAWVTKQTPEKEIPLALGLGIIYNTL